MKHHVLIGLGLILGIEASAETQIHGTWKSFRHGPQNQANHSLAVKSLPPLTATEKVQETSVGGLIWGTAVIDEYNNSYVGSSNKNFYSFDGTGKLRWSYTIYDRADSLIDSAAVLAPNNLVVVPGGDGYLHALDRTTGERRWDFKAHHTSDEGHQQGATVNSFEGNVQLGPNQLIYAGSDNGYMYALDAQGKEVWSFKTNMMIWSTPAFDPQGKWMAFGSLDGHLYVLEPNSGKLIDKVDIGYDVKSSPTVDSHGNIYFGASNFNFYSYHLVNGKLVQRWEFTEARGEIYSSAALKNDTLVFGSLEGAVYAVNSQGKLLWKFLTYSPVASSPLITQDGVVLFGARNGKLYAVDLASGERLWSYATTLALRKSNLDASVALDANGTVVVGSYDGVIFRIPYQYCPQNRQEARCQFGGKNDAPDFGRQLAANEATLAYFSPDGKFSAAPSRALRLTDVIKMQLVVLKDGIWQMNRAISNLGLKWKITPAIDVKVEVSSDGQFVNLMAQEAFEPNQTYHLEISGKHYPQKTWLWDRLSWFNNEEFSAKLSFTTEGREETNWNVLTRGVMGIRSLYLMQPQALDTYIPAALDGQGFIARAFAIDRSKGRFLIHVSPALPAGEELLPLAEPSKVFIMRGYTYGQHLRVEGAVKISAMGGTIDFSKMSERGVLPPEDGSVVNSFYSEASCLSIQGNGNNYQFPFKLVNRVCDNWLKLKSLGQMSFVHFGGAQPLGTTVDFGAQEILLKLTHPDSKARTASIVVYDPEDLSILHQEIKQVNSEVVFKGFSRRAGAHVAVFLGEHLVSERAL